MNIHPEAHNFGGVAEAYDRRRPSYPAQVLTLLEQNLGLGRSPIVLDLAAGTGKFTRLLARSGAHTIAVEPVAGMRGRPVGVGP